MRASAWRGRTQEHSEKEIHTDAKQRQVSACNAIGRGERETVLEEELSERNPRNSISCGTLTPDSAGHHAGPHAPGATRRENQHQNAPAGTHHQVISSLSTNPRTSPSRSCDHVERRDEWVCARNSHKF